MKTIEFMGLPGAGKTTLASVLLRTLRAKGMPVLSQAEAINLCIRRRDDGILINALKHLPKAWWEPCAGIQKALPEMHRFSYRHVSLLHLISSTIERNSLPENWSESFLYTFFRQFAEHQLAEDYLQKQEVRVVEEGFLHRGFTLFGYLAAASASDELLKRYVDSIPLPSAVIFIDVSPEECWGRLQKRVEPPVPLKAREKGDAIGQLAVGHSCLQRIAALSERKNITVLSVGNSQDEAIPLEKRLEAVVASLGTY
ncbi:MAG: AAA family ATPase [Desulforhabdus sp.]|jgi:thymidylate kinase|nr:AAA family ATPase [Desulforhabdus sp.]